MWMAWAEEDADVIPVLKGLAEEDLVAWQAKEDLDGVGWAGLGQRKTCSIGILTLSL